MSSQKSWFISAGEYSGDLLARDLVKQVSQLDSEVTFFGIGGDEMEKAGVNIDIHLSRLSVMGLVEIFSKLVEIVQIEQKILELIEEKKPEVCILVDFPGFHFRLAKRLRARGFKVVQYVAPKVWAWGQKRVVKLRDDFDLVLGVLPFEKDFFEKHGVNYKYVGSPHIDRIEGVKAEIADFNLDPKSKYVALLPGSRKSEVRRVAPEILKIIAKLKSGTASSGENIKCLVPVAPNLDHRFVISHFIGKEFESSDPFESPIAIEDFVFVPGQSLEIMKIADAAMLTSGTATLECGLLSTPMIVLYMMNGLSYHIAKLKLKVNWISLVNLSVNKTLVNEYIQHIEYEAVANELSELLDTGADRRRDQIEGLEKMKLNYFGNAEKLAAEEIEKLVRS
jgi:lipid-A-disaccharide synthase